MTNKEMETREMARIYGSAIQETVANFYDGWGIRIMLLLCKLSEEEEEGGPIT